MPGPVCSGINRATSRDSSTEHAPNRKGGPGMMALWRDDRNVCLCKYSDYMCSLFVLCFFFVHPHLISGVGHVGFGTFLRAVWVGQLHVEQVEDKTVESRAQTVTQAPNSCNHPLDNTYRQTERNTTLSGGSFISGPVWMSITNICQELHSSWNIEGRARNLTWMCQLSASSKTLRVKYMRYMLQILRIFQSTEVVKKCLCCLFIFIFIFLPLNLGLKFLTQTNLK